jgi:hypothetical protein
MNNKDIDHSDIPSLTDAQLAAMKPLREILPQAVPKSSYHHPPGRGYRSMVQRTSATGRRRELSRGESQKWRRQKSLRR